MIGRSLDNWGMVGRGSNSFNNWGMVSGCLDDRGVIGWGSMDNRSMISGGSNSFDNRGVVSGGSVDNRGVIGWSSNGFHNWGVVGWSSVDNWSSMVNWGGSISLFNWESSWGNSSSSRLLVASIAMYRLRSSVGLAHNRSVYSSMGLVHRVA